MGERRYSVWPIIESARAMGPAHDSWAKADLERTRLLSIDDYGWKIWDHSTPRPTDVSEADPDTMVAGKRYGVCLYQSDAALGLAGSRQYATWQEANNARTGDMRIWDHSTPTPTDVTDADPEATWWYLYWGLDDGFKAMVFTGEKVKTIGHTSLLYWDSDFNSCELSRRFPEGYTPTVRDLNEALAPYNVSVPVPEDPQWWHWDQISKVWTAYGFKNHRAMVIDGVSVWIWGTTADRDEKRDMMLDMARKVGKE